MSCDKGADQDSQPVSNREDIQQIKNDLTILSSNIAASMVGIQADIDTTSVSARSNLTKIKSSFSHYNKRVIGMLFRLNTTPVPSEDLVMQAYQLTIEAKIAAYRLTFRKHYAYK